MSSSDGSDAFNGRSESTAFKTLARVSRLRLSPGDIVFLKRGDTWREVLTVTSSGMPDTYIKYAAYGNEKNNPRIFGSEAAVKWIQAGQCLWRTDEKYPDPDIHEYPSEIFFVQKDGAVSWGKHRSDEESLTDEFNWTWDSDHVYVYSEMDPGTKYRSVEIPQRKTCIDLNDKNYLHFDGISVFFAVETGYSYHSYPMRPRSGLIIENAEAAYFNKKNGEIGYGIDASYSDMIVRNCEIHNCGRRGISFHVYGSYKASDILIENNYFHDGFHTTGPDFSVGSSSSFVSFFDSVIIRRNLFYDPPASQALSQQIFLQDYNQGTSTSIQNVLIYSNIFKSPPSSAIMAEGITSLFIYNNTFYNHNITKSGNTMHIWLDHGNHLVEVKNNIFYTILTNDNNSNGVEIFLGSEQKYESVCSDYNLYYRTDKNLRIVERDGIDTYAIRNFDLLQSEFGWEKHSPIPSDPMFNNPANNDFALMSGSPAVGSGVSLGLPVDYLGNVYKTANPSIGALEGNPGSR